MTIIIRKYLLYSLLLVVLSSFITACPNDKEQNSSTEADNGSQLIARSHEPTQQPPAKTANNTKIFSSISPTQAYQMLQSRKDILLLDVRSMEERAQVSIPGSQYLPIGAIFKGTISLPQDKAILLFCAVGGRSYAAAKILSARGQHEVYNLSGGIEAWYKAGLPVLPGSGK